MKASTQRAVILGVGDLQLGRAVGPRLRLQQRDDHVGLARPELAVAVHVLAGLEHAVAVGVLVGADRLVAG